MRGDVAATRLISQGEYLAATGGVTASPVLYGPDGAQLVLPKPVQDAWGPGTPLAPRIGGPAYPPREYQYPTGWNLTSTPRAEEGLTSFVALRALASFCVYARIAINYRKSQLRGLKWEFVPRDCDDLTRSERKKFKAQTDAAKTFWRIPNRLDRQDWGAWISCLYEEMATTDATSVYVQRTRDGSPHSLVPIDGQTIKPVIDQWGHPVEYQQCLYGYPNTSYTPDELRYLVFAPRVNSVYGRPPIEEIAPIVNVAIRRTLEQLARYTDGNVPFATMEAPLEWSPEQILSFQKYLDTQWVDGALTRNRIKVLPGGAKVSAIQPFTFSKDEEESLLTQIVAYFGVSRSWLVAQVNRATAESGADESDDIGLKPVQNWIKEFVDDITENVLGIPDIEFRWSSSRVGAEEAKSKIQVSLVTAGIMTVNEARAERGLDPIAEPVAAPVAGTEAKPAEPKQELEQWLRFSTKPDRIKRRRWADPFDVVALPPEMAEEIRAALAAAETPDGVREAFRAARTRLVA